MSDDERYRELGKTVKKGGIWKWIAILIALLLLSAAFLGENKMDLGGSTSFLFPFLEHKIYLWAGAVPWPCGRRW